MVVKVYISGISGNKEVKKRQQRVLMILESKSITYEAIDITEPGREDDKEYMQKNGQPKDNAKYPLPPQIFCNDLYCGDYDEFDLANENDTLQSFLKLSDAEISSKSIQLTQPEHTSTTNGISTSREASVEHEASHASVEHEATLASNEHDDSHASVEHEASHDEMESSIPPALDSAQPPDQTPDDHEQPAELRAEDAEEKADDVSREDEDEEEADGEA